MTKVEDFVNATIDQWERDGVVLIANFEGENTGWGGELQVVQFLPTIAVDSSTLQRSDRATTTPPNGADIGLLYI